MLWFFWRRVFNINELIPTPQNWNVVKLKNKSKQYAIKSYWRGQKQIHLKDIDIDNIDVDDIDIDNIDIDNIDVDDIDIDNIDIDDIDIDNIDVDNIDIGDIDNIDILTCQVAGLFISIVKWEYQARP